MLISFIFNGLMLAQDYSKASANIRVKLINGAMSSIIKSTLSFDESSGNVEGEYKIEPRKGAHLKLTEVNDGDIISYNEKEIDKIIEENESTADYEFKENGLLFHPEFQKSCEIDKTNDIGIINGSTFAFNSIKKNGTVNLWVGGSVNFPNSIENGIYGKKFAISVVY
jgi:hypothetical protein